MDTSTMGRKRGIQYRRRKNDFTYWDKSSSEPDLTATTENPHTRSSFTLYNKSETYIPFSALKTEYQREYCNGGTTAANMSLSPRAPLLRRSTSLKLPGMTDDLGGGGVGGASIEAAESEQHSEYHPYTDDEMSNCRRSLANRPDNLGANENASDPIELHGQSVHFDGNIAFMSEPHFDAKQKYDSAGKHASQINHLNLTGELSMVPEYRSQFVTFPIEKSHSIPQISNINFQGKFGGVAEYRDSFREYDRYSKCDAIRNPGHLKTNGSVKTETDGGGAEYSEKYKAPDHRAMNKSVLAKRPDTFRLPEQSASRQAEYNDCFTDPKQTILPVRGKPRPDFLGLNGKMVYSPEYRSTYLDFPRARPTLNKPKSNFQIGDRHNQKSSRSPSPTLNKFEPNPLIKNIHDPNLEDIPFLYQPEVRRAKQDLLIKERISRKDTLPISSHILNDDHIVDISISRKPDSNPTPSRNLSPKFKLTVKNVDDTGGQFKKTTPKFGRRSNAVKEVHKMRNRTKVVEGNRVYSQQSVGQQPSKRSAENPQSFVVLKEPCPPSNWMKSSWYS